MEKQRLELLAEANLFNLGGNVYPGCGIAVGLDETGEFLVQVYLTTGRKENSRNCILVSDGDGLLSTEPVDASLIIYNAMREVRHNGVNFAIVSNGSQTDRVAEGYGEDETLEHSMHRRDSYEPDAPNYTPRITAVSYWASNCPAIRMALLRKSPWGVCDRHLHEINDIGRGFGYCFTTYTGDGSPLPPFQGERYLLPLRGSMGSIMGSLWGALNPENRVSLAVKFIPQKGPSETAIINKYQRV